jgi:cyanophycinase
MNIRNRDEVNNPDLLERIKNCNVVMFSGGNQLRLTACFGGTTFLDVIKDRLQNDETFVVAGTSAGAMAMSNTMIYEGNATRAHLKGEVKITTGLGFMYNVIFDSHFEKRGRFGRLVQAVSANPSCIGIGLGEDTGMVIKNGSEMEAIGSGLVMIIDGHNIKYSNIADIPEGTPISVENIKVHLCVNGNGYKVNERKFVQAFEHSNLLESKKFENPNFIY